MIGRKGGTQDIPGVGDGGEAPDSSVGWANRMRQESETPRKSLQQLIEEGVAARHHPSIPPIERAAGKLRQVVKWHGEMPATDRVTDGIIQAAPGQTLTFGAAFGSCGERDFMRALVSSALLDLNEVKDGSTEALKELLAAWEADDLPRWRRALIAARKVVAR